jgi:hypothetical protein
LNRQSRARWIAQERLWERHDRTPNW